MAPVASSRHSGNATHASGEPGTSHGYCAPYAALHQERFTPLENYILRTEHLEHLEHTSRAPIFSNQAVAPRLHVNQENRILVFSGSFNPPHLGHLELLAHVFLRTDSRTISAMLVPLGSGTCRKNNATVKGRTFRLSKNQRAYLWQDEVLGRFSWVYRDDTDSLPRFRSTMIMLAKVDGYKLAFTGLNGSDHYTLNSGLGGLGLRCESSITSDVTRPSVLLQDGRTQPERLVGCGSWRKILPVESVVSKGRVHCWACWKFQMLCPELGGEQAANIFNFPGLGDIAGDILRRCHESDGVVWWCQRNTGGSVWFFPSGRIYPTDERRVTISSTTIRKLIDEVPGDHIHNTIKSLSINTETLVKILGLYQQSRAESDLGGNDGHDDSLKGKGKDYEKSKLKIKALSQMLVDIIRHRYLKRSRTICF